MYRKSKRFLKGIAVGLLCAAMEMGNFSSICPAIVAYAEVAGSEVTEIEVAEGEMTDTDIVAGSVTESGTCGDNLVWTYDDGTLTISGIGDMYDYTWNNMPWENYIWDVEKIVLNEGVTTIGTNAFYFCSSEEVRIPSTVTTIKANAFDNTTVGRYYIPSSVQTIEAEAFTNVCSGAVIFEGDFPNGLSYKAFDDATVAVYYPADNDSWKSIKTSSFSANSISFEEYSESSHTHIYHLMNVGGYNYQYACAFCGDRLVSKLPDGVDISNQEYGTCGTNVFWYILGDTLYVAGNGSMGKSSSLADYGDNIKKIMICDGVTSVYGKGFSNYSYSGVEEIYISASVTSIASGAFSGCNSLKTITFAGAMPTMSSDMLPDYHYSTITIKYPVSESSWASHPDFADVVFTADISALDIPEINLGSGVIEVDIAAGKTVMVQVNPVWTGEYYLNLTDCENGKISLLDSNLNVIKSVDSDEIAADLENGKKYIFEISLTDFTQSRKVTAILTNNHSHSAGDRKTVEPTCTEEGYVIYTCYYCQVEYRGYVLTATGHSFDDNNICIVCGYDANSDIKYQGTFGTNNMKWELSYGGTLTISGTGEMQYLENGSYPWKDYRNVITSLVIAEGVTAVSKKAFEGFTKITKISLPDTLKNIGEYAFSQTGISEIVLPDDITTIESYAFYKCQNLSTVTYPANLDTIESCAFRDTSIVDVDLTGTSVTTMGAYVYSSSAGLNSVKVPNSLQILLGNPFWGSDWYANEKKTDDEGFVTVRGTLVDYVGPTDSETLYTLYIPEGVKVVTCWYAFESDITQNGYVTNLTTHVLVLPEGFLYLQDKACFNWMNLTDAYIPSSVTSIGYMALGWYDWGEIDGPKGILDTVLRIHGERGTEAEAYCTRYYDSDFWNDFIFVEGYNPPAQPNKLTEDNTEVVFDSLEVQYDSSLPAYPRVQSVKYNGKVLNQNVDFITDIGDDHNVGNHIITIKGIGDYRGSLEFSYEITPAPIKDKVSIYYSIYWEDLYYTGNPITPNYELDARGAKEGVDYILTIENNIEPGTGIVRVKGIGNYTGEITKEFTINPVNELTETSCFWRLLPDGVEKDGVEWTGSEVTVGVFVIYNGNEAYNGDNGVRLQENRDYKVSFTNNIDPGTATVTITGINGYSGTLSKNFTIVKENRLSPVLGQVMPIDQVIGAEILLNRIEIPDEADYTDSEYYYLFAYTATKEQRFFIYSEGTYDTQGALWNSEMKNLAYSDDDGDGVNFFISYEMEAGATYYIGIRGYNGADVAARFMFEEAPAECEIGKHTMEVYEREATCQSGGVQAYYTCSVCRCVYDDAEGKTLLTEYVYSNPLGHIFDRDGKCTRKGCSAVTKEVSEGKNPVEFHGLYGCELYVASDDEWYGEPYRFVATSDGVLKASIDFNESDYCIFVFNDKFELMGKNKAVNVVAENVYFICLQFLVEPYEGDFTVSVTPDSEAGNTLSCDVSVTIEDNLGLNYYIEIPDRANYKKLYVNTELDRYDSKGNIVVETKENVKYEELTENRIKVTVDNIAAKEVGDKVRVYVVGEMEDGSQKKFDAITCSVADYCYTQIRSKDATDELKIMLVDLLNYCAAAQEYFEYRTDSPVNRDLTSTERTLATGDSVLKLNNVAATEEYDNATATFVGSSLLINNRVEIKTYINLASDVDRNKMTVEFIRNMNGVLVKKEIPFSELVKVSDGVYAVCYSDYNVAQFGEAISIVVKENGTVISDTIVFNVESYAYLVLNGESSDVKLQSLVKQMMKFSRSTASYLAVKK